MDVSWNVLLAVGIGVALVEGAMGVLFVGAVWPWTQRPAERKQTEWQALAFMATTPLVIAALLVAAIGGRPGDQAGALGAFLMWIGQLPFQFAALPVLDWKLAKARRAEARARDLAALGRAFAKAEDANET